LPGGEEENRGREDKIRCYILLLFPPAPLSLLLKKEPIFSGSRHDTAFLFLKGAMMVKKKKAKPDETDISGSRQYGLDLRLRNQGLIGVGSKIPLIDSSALSLLYTPGVAAPCLEIAENPIRSFDETPSPWSATVLLSTDLEVPGLNQRLPCSKAVPFFSRPSRVLTPCPLP
jgi:hypothetical protein